MKLFFVILAFAICGGIAFYMINEENRKRRAEEYQRAEIERKREEERVEKERREDERIRKERMEALAKEDAVLMLQRYVTREENNLKDTIEECKLKLQSIDVDQQSLSDELLALEKEEELKAADAKKRKMKRRDANERVEALLRSPTLNRLANSYLGEDLSDDLAKYRSHIGNLTRISDEKTKRYAQNRAKYQKSIADNDAEVDRLGSEASVKLSEARAKLNANVNVARKRVEDLRGRIAKLEKKAEWVKAPAHPKPFNEMTAEERIEAVKADPLYGKIICRCEVVTEAEIRAAIRRPVGATSVDGVKRRTRAGMGRCQGGFCSPRVVEILAEELQIPMTSVRKGGLGSELLVGTIQESMGKAVEA